MTLRRPYHHKQLSCQCVQYSRIKQYMLVVPPAENVPSSSESSLRFAHSKRSLLAKFSQLAPAWRKFYTVCRRQAMAPLTSARLCTANITSRTSPSVGNLLSMLPSTPCIDPCGLGAKNALAVALVFGLPSRPLLNLGGNGILPTT